ncbi:hypothetical protein Tco_0538647, partial [Tanacetum coccineum]
LFAARASNAYVQRIRAWNQYLLLKIASPEKEKTSLISAMLGGLPPLENSSAMIRGIVAYVPQIPWTIPDSQGNRKDRSTKRRDLNVTGIPCVKSQVHMPKGIGITLSDTLKKEKSQDPKNDA